MGTEEGILLMVLFTLAGIRIISWATQVHRALGIALLLLSMAVVVFLSTAWKVHPFVPMVSMFMLWGGYGIGMEDRAAASRGPEPLAAPPAESPRPEPPVAAANSEPRPARACPGCGAVAREGDPCRYCGRQV